MLFTDPVPQNGTRYQSGGVLFPPSLASGRDSLQGMVERVASARYLLTPVRETDCLLLCEVPQVGQTPLAHQGSQQHFRSTKLARPAPC